ncbi:hypothetical protein AB0B89_27335, partial [Sphaerisporangium sp. NPDC049002]
PDAVRTAHPGAEWLARAEKALGEALELTGGEAELDTAVTKVIYSRRFYNNAVEVTRQAQRRWLARTLRLAGHTEYPSYFEIDDDEPASFAQQS